jgi:hypothetical protein
MSISKSRRPKFERVARELDDELLPYPKDYYASARYIDRRAELGDFRGKGKPASALLVLHYLWRHTVRNADNVKLGPNESVGWVLTGKCPIGKIADECNVSYTTARTTLHWLFVNEWLDGEYTTDQTIAIRVRMDIEGHKARLAVLGHTMPTVGTVTPDRANDCHGTVPTVGGDRADDCGGTVPTVGRQYRDSYREPNKDSYRDPAESEDQGQTQEPGQDDVPSVELSPAELRNAVLGYVRTHGSRLQPVRSGEVARRLYARQRAVDDALIDLTSSGMLDARQGQYWPR